MRRFIPLVALLPCLFAAAVFAQDASSRGDRGERGDRSERHRRRDSGGFGRTRDGEGSGNYELRGFFGSGTDTEISLRLSGTDKAYWIRVGDRMKDKEKDIYVEKVNPVVGTAVIITGGVRYKLRLAGEIPASARQGMQALPETATASVSGQGTVTISGAGTYTGATTVSTGTLTIVRPAENGGQAQTVVIQTTNAQPSGNNPPTPPAGTEPAPPPAVQGSAPNDASPSPGGRS